MNRGQTLCTRQSSQGQTLFELIIALAVTALVVTGIIRVVTISVRNATFAKNQAESTRIAQEGLEWLRVQRDSGWTSFASRSNSTYCLSSLDWGRQRPCRDAEKISDTFTREATLTTLSSDNIEVLLRVSWTDPAGRHESRLDTRLTRWREIITEGEDED